ncbi:hypothetical protein BH18ACI4_BH18ACI4_28610 [soil metagenome]
MKAPDEILDELHKLKESGQTLQPRALLEQLINLTETVADMWNQQPHKASSKETREIFED